jgi:hypothetical protein
MSTNGLMGGVAYRKVDVPYYAPDTVAPGPAPGPVSTLLSNVSVLSADESVSSILSTTGNSVPTYKGGLSITSGANASGPATTAITTRTTGATTNQVEIGVNAQTNRLMIAGASGLSQVNDPIYNPVVIPAPALPTVTTVGAQQVALIGPSPSVNHPGGWLTDSPSPGVIFGSGGAGPFTVPATGLYWLQATLLMPEGTSSSGAIATAFTVRLTNSPFTPAGGIVVVEANALAAPSDDIPAYYNWGGYLSLVSGTSYNVDLRQISGGVVSFGANADLAVQLVRISSTASVA